MSIVLGTIFVIFLLLWNKFPISSNKIPANVISRDRGRLHDSSSHQEAVADLSAGHDVSAERDVAAQGVGGEGDG